MDPPNPIVALFNPRGNGLRKFDSALPDDAST